MLAAKTKASQWHNHAAKEANDILRYLAANNSEFTFFRKPASSQLAERLASLFSNGREGFVTDSASLLFVD